MTQTRNRLLWIIPLGCLGLSVMSVGGCLMLIGGGGWFLYRTATNHPVYKDSVERIQKDPIFQHLKTRSANLQQDQKFV